MSTAALFERLAERYDELWTETPVGRAQRNAVWEVTDRLFGTGDRVLDVGCGTGEDAAHLAGRGVVVHAVDASPAMVARARARGGFSVEVMRAEELKGVGFDAALSNFGALNCVEDLGAVVRALGRSVRPGGYIAICVMGRFCAWETLYYGVRINFRKAGRRWNGRSSDVYYPTIAQLRILFAGAFELCEWYGVGMLVPPSYVKLPGRIVNLLARFDRLPFLRAWADHRLLIFKRT